MRMSGFESFIYMLGAVTFAAAVPTIMFWLINRIERPRRRR